MFAAVLSLRYPWHMGALHPYEQGLTLLLAFGPFVVLGIVIWRRSRAEHADHEAVSEAGSAASEVASRTARAEPGEARAGGGE